MLAAYRGYSVILFAPLAAMGAVLLSHPAEVPPMFTGLFMDRMVGFVENFFPSLCSEPFLEKSLSCLVFQNKRLCGTLVGHDLWGVYLLEDRNLRRGIAAWCVGGGMGLAMAIERC